MTAEATGRPGPRAGRSESREGEVDLYETLEVSPQASPPVIQAAYRALARQIHPDVHPEVNDAAAECHIRRLNAAYCILGDPRARAKYDQERASARRAQRALTIQHSVHTGATAIGDTSVRASRSQALQARSTITGTEDHFSVARASTALVLLVVAGFTVLSLLLVWNSLDPSHDDVRAYTPAQVQIAPR